MIALTPRQEELVIFLQTHLKAYGIAPSYDQIGIAIGLKARSAVAKEVIALERARLIRRIPGCNNAIELLPSEDHHTPDCICAVCADVRYFRALQLVHALEVAPPTRIIFTLSPNSNLRLYSPAPEVRAQLRHGAL